MEYILKRFKHNNLFIIMFLITFLIISIVSITIIWTTVRMAEEFFFEKFSISNAKIMNQVKDNLESFNYSIVLASNNLLQNGTVREVLSEDGSNMEKMDAYYMLSQQMKRIQPYLVPHNVSVIASGKNGLVFATDRSYWPIKDAELKDSDLTRQTLIQPKKLMYHFDHQARGNANTGDERFIVASRGLMERSSGNVYGAMYFAVKESDFRYKAYNNYTSPGNDVFIVDKDGIIVSSSQTKLIGKVEKGLLNYARDIKKTPNAYVVGDILGKEHIILAEYLPYFDMYMFNVIDKETAIGDLIDKKKIAVISLFIVLAALLVVFLATRRLTNSLSSLVKQIENASKTDFHQYVSVTGTYETRQIGNAFNSMLDELQEYVDQLVHSQRQQRNAELAALQQQINPHFLYNTLTSIKFMVQQGEKAETEATINALISLLQNTIGNVSETITVEQEINNLKNYVLINQKRYGNRIKVNYFVSPDCLNYQIPKLILQPFMENSFFHGFNHKPEGTITVLIWQDGENLVCEVADNGDGMEVTADTRLPPKRRKQQLFSGIGVKNVHERIQLIYGSQYGVSISSEVGEGTKVHITLPIKQD
jgi:two-component system, sensor histidine kinase YesM